eukprot:15074877-Alexandrium_andersonii.AAC.1
MSASLVGSEMCIRDRSSSLPALVQPSPSHARSRTGCTAPEVRSRATSPACLLYTSDAADDM